MSLTYHHFQVECMDKEPAPALLAEQLQEGLNLGVMTFVHLCENSQWQKQ